MNNDEYQKLPGVSSHQLIAMLESPANCWRKYIDPQRPQQETTASLTFGTLIHCLALNPHTFDDEFLVADYEQRSKAGKERYAQLKQYGLKVIKPEEHDRARAIVTKLQCNPESRALLRHGKERANNYPASTKRIAPAESPVGCSQRSEATSHRTENNMEYRPS
ncbi:MAG: PD-(D/E)XK nuclease-like domain-containing protein [Candidatus Competibacteraceae bacterium]|nr:PD-(D/E)XK nuclease-like domain-containing protein [Candidatus Competibacteraceae bacterium]